MDDSVLKRIWHVWVWNF